MKVDGQCHCGAVAYEAEVDPATVTVCHCTDCQTLTGSAFRVGIPAPAAGFRLLRGIPHQYIKTAASGARRIHAFCGTCGGPVYSCAVANPRSYSLRVGALRQRAELGRPIRQTWVKRRLPWVPPLPSVPETEEQ